MSMYARDATCTRLERLTRTWCCGAVAVALACMVLAGCKRKQQAAPEPAAPGPATPEPEAPASPTPEPAALAEAEAEAEVHALLEAWQLAQNRGDFERYAAHYAADFRGVKRAGTSEKSFDREGWLADRKGMFSRPMKVE